MPLGRCSENYCNSRCVQLIELEMLLSEGEVVDRAVSILFLVFITPSCSCFLDSFFGLLVLECAEIVAYGRRGEESGGWMQERFQI